MNRAWAYIISKPLTEVQLGELLQAGQSFVLSWTAHEQKLSASFSIFAKRIIVVKVNEDITNASGCSIDKLTHFIKNTEVTFNVELLNRLLVAYKKENSIEVVHASKIKDLLSQNIISEDTIIYNTGLANEKELEQWEQPLKKTWLNKYLVKI